MNTWTLNFSQRIDYSLDDEITLAIRLFVQEMCYEERKS